MRKQLTGEPVAGELHSGFGGRGRRAPFPTPIQPFIVDTTVQAKAIAHPTDSRLLEIARHKVASSTKSALRIVCTPHER